MSERKWPCTRKIDLAALRASHAAGQDDVQIAAAQGVDRHTVMKWRWRLGLEAVPRTDAARAKLSEANRRQVERAGVRSARQCGPNRYVAASRKLAGQYGLPSDLRPVQVAILVALSAGPRTAASLADAVGRGPSRQSEFHRFNFPKVPGGNYLTNLRRRGLIEMIAQGRTNGSGRGQSLFFLSGMAMDLMTQRRTT